MKKLTFNAHAKILRGFTGFLILASFVVINSGCTKDLLKKELSENELRKLNIPIASDYHTVVLVSDVTGYGALRIDENLVNPWGIAINPNGPIWISANHTGKSVIYNDQGVQLRAPVNIPLGTDLNGASPTGQVFNNTTDFIIPGKGKASFIFSTEDGILSGWNNTLGTTAVTVADMSSTGAVYKGIALANDGGANFLYATDFHNAKIDVFDKNFARVTTKPFSDPEIPAGFAPFNIQNIDGMLWVTYAKQLAPDNEDDEAGVGNGYVDIFSSSGQLVKRFASQGLLNSPWGITPVLNKFGQIANAILIGNFGDGHINVYSMDGTFQGQMKEKGKPLTIDGLWAITFDPAVTADPGKLYFTAGPDEETHGLFGYIEKQ